MNDFTLLITHFFALFMESAPWLLLGLLVAGIMHELVPVALLQKHMGNSSVGAIVKSAFIGAPLPLCSCGVIPAALGLRRSGASRPATVSFLVSTPETGVDSVSVSYALLGPVFAVVRPFAAIASAIYTGLMVKWFAEKDPIPASKPAAADNVKSCCSSATKKPPVSDTESCCSSKPVKTTSSCCNSEPPAQSDASSCCGTTSATAGSKAAVTPKKNSIADVIHYASGKLLEDITVWLLVGLVLAAVIQTWVPSSFLTQWGDGFIAMLVMALIGVPMYICATASTPIAVGFLAAGLSPGAILVFLLAGPATNISTMGMIGRELGKRSLLLYIFCILTASIGLGYLLNVIIELMHWQSLIPMGEAGLLHGEGTQAIYALCAVILAALMIRNGWKALQQKFSKGNKAESCCH